MTNSYHAPRGGAQFPASPAGGFAWLPGPVVLHLRRLPHCARSVFLVAVLRAAGRRAPVTLATLAELAGVTRNRARESLRAAAALGLVVVEPAPRDDGSIAGLRLRFPWRDGTPGGEGTVPAGGTPPSPPGVPPPLPAEGTPPPPRRGDGPPPSPEPKTAPNGSPSRARPRATHAGGEGERDLNNPPNPPETAGDARGVALVLLRSFPAHRGTPLARLRAGTIERWADELIAACSPAVTPAEVRAWLAAAAADPEIVGATARGPRWKWPARAACDVERVRAFVGASRRERAELRAAVRAVVAAPERPRSTGVACPPELLAGLLDGTPARRTRPKGTRP